MMWQSIWQRHLNGWKRYFGSVLGALGSLWQKEGVMTAGVQLVAVEAWPGCIRVARGGSKELGPEQGLGYNPQPLNSVTHPYWQHLPHQIFQNLPKWHQALGMNCSNICSCGGHNRAKWQHSIKSYALPEVQYSIPNTEAPRSVWF